MAGPLMRHLLNLAVLMMFCLCPLFFISPDKGYVAAFLYCVSLCCLNSFIDSILLFRLLIICWMSFGFLCPEFLFFFPMILYLLSERKQLFLFISCCILFFILASINSLPAILIYIEGCSGAAAVFLQYRTSQEDSLRTSLKHIRDDSMERDILLTEKNRALLEKQDYEIYTATLRERNRIAREIHDNVGHLLSRSILLVGAAKAVSREKGSALGQSLDSLDMTLNSAMDSVRKSVHDLHDDAVNLEEAVSSLVHDFSFCPLDFICDAGPVIPRDVKYSFISIVKEALSNIIRHSNATHAIVTIREHPAFYRLSIEDNGTGAAVKDTGIGLLNMKERIRSLNGCLQVMTEYGFRIYITIPKENSI